MSPSAVRASHALLPAPERERIAVADVNGGGGEAFDHHQRM